MSRTVPNDVSKTPKATPETPAPDTVAEIEQRIERLEKRLEETIAETSENNDRHHRPKLDDSEIDDPLRRSVERVNERRTA